MKKKNKDKIILDLCGGTGSWSLPYKNAGYDVRNVTLPNHDITKTFLGKNEIYFGGKYKFSVKTKSVYGILAAPPCTMFSFARTNAKKSRDLRGSMEIVKACLDIIWEVQFGLNSDQQKYSPLKFWALENPYFAMTKWFLGKPAFVFDPYDFGHYYQKRTALWGHFNEPKKNPIKIPEEAKNSTNRGRPTSMWKKMKEESKTNSQELPKFDYMKSKDIVPEWFGKLTRKARRSITPKGFALAFYKENK